MHPPLFQALAALQTADGQSPIQKVVTLITEMKATTIKEGEEDLAAYDKYKCWCETTEAEKTAAIEAATTKLQELSSFVEEAAAKEGELKTEIAGLEADIAADKEALATATTLRNEENAAFSTEEADYKETLGLLDEAVAVLSKVQLVQKPQEKAQALLQVRDLVKKANPKFKSVMQKDLYDMLGEFDGVDTLKQKEFKKTVATGSFLGEVFLPKREAAVLAQSQIPTGYNADGSVTSEEDLAKATNPNSGKGAASGAKSHNSRSGGILGLLKAQHDEFSTKLASAQKNEAQALSDFNKLAAAKNAEISAATSQADNKAIELSDLMDKAAKAKEDIEATTNTLSEDEKYVAEAIQSCASEDAEYAKRTKVRNEEVKALSETLDILTGDEARSLFDKTINFLQVGIVQRSSSAVVAAQEAAKNKAFQRILKIAKSNKNWMLASLAVRVKLDAFTKVKAAMDKMLAELASQQKAEVAKYESCKKQIDATEDKVWDDKVVKRDVAAKHKDLENTIATLTKDIDDLKTEVSESQISLKQAGENRKAENALFQTTISDQRAMITVLNMALKRLKEFYEPSLVEVHAHAAPPPKPSGPEATGYKKSGSSGGVMQLLSMIIADAERTDDEMAASENESQKEYAGFVSSTTASIEADRKAISEKEEQMATAESEKSETEESQLANQASLDKGADLLTQLHGQCDYVLKYFTIRQESRKDEMDGIEEAKAILSGADFS